MEIDTAGTIGRRGEGGYDQVASAMGNDTAGAIGHSFESSNDYQADQCQVHFVFEGL